MRATSLAILLILSLALPGFYALPVGHLPTAQVPVVRGSVSPTTTPSPTTGSIAPWTAGPLSVCDQKHPSMAFPLRPAELAVNLACSYQSLVGPLMPSSAEARYQGVATGSLPPQFGIYNLQMTYDAADKMVILFGATGSGPLNGTETWAFAGGHWVELSPPNTPESCFGSAMTYDNVDGYVVYFAGGNFGSGASCPNAGQTWKFSGGNWTQLFPTNSPPVRLSAGFTNDSADGYDLLFGGACNLGIHFGLCGDTWKFVGGQWTNLTQPNASAPAPRAGAGMTYDASDGFVLLFGGTAWPVNAAQPLTVTDTWKYSKGTWTQIPLGGLLCGGSTQPSCGNLAPSGIYNDGLTYDAADGYALYTCAYNNASYLKPELYWTFHAGTWTNLNNVSLYNVSWLPENRIAEGLTYDWNDGYSLLFGGVTPQWVILNDTWSYLGGLWTAVLHQPLTVTASANQTTGTAPLAIQFHSSVVGGTGPYALQWYFGDGTNSTQADPTHVYSKPGNYTVKVNVTDARGTTNATQLQIRVTSTPPLLLTPSALPSSGLPPLTVHFSDQAAGGVPPYKAWFWNFGNGSYAYTQNATDTFYNYGTFLVHTSVQDALGTVANATIQVTVNPSVITLAKVTVLPATDTVAENGSVRLIADPVCSGGACPSGVTVSWSLNNSLGSVTPGTGNSTVFTAGPTAGSVDVLVTASLNSRSVTNSSQITISASSVPSLTSVSLLPTTASLNLGQAASFKATPVCTGGAPCPQGAVYSWALSNSHIGHLNTSTGPEVTFTAQSNTGSAQLNVTVALNGRTANASASIQVVSQSGSPQSANYAADEWLGLGIVSGGVVVGVVWYYRSTHRRPPLQTPPADPPAGDPPAKP